MWLTPKRFLELADPDAAARLDLAREDLAAEPFGDGVDDAVRRIVSSVLVRFIAYRI